MAQISRTDLIEEVARETGKTKADVKQVVDSFFDALEGRIANGDDVTIPGVVSFKRVHREARQGRNPQTGEAMTIAAGPSIKVTAGSKVKAAVKND